MSATLHMEKLCNVAELNPKFKEKLKSDSSVSFVPMAAVLAEMSTVTGEEKQYCEVSKGYTSFVDGDVLVAKITPCFENGKITQAKLKNRVGFGSTEFHVVRPVEGKLDARYLLHFLRQERIRLEGERKMTGSAGQRRVPANFLGSLEIPLLPLPEQKRIADILDRAEALRAKRRVTLDQLDELVQSIFIEMFGDPRSPTKRKNEKIRVRDVIDIIVPTRDKPKSFTGNIPWITLPDLANSIYIEDSKYKLSKEEARPTKTRLFPKETVILSCAGSLGKVAISTNEVYTNQQFYGLVCDKKRIIPEFLAYYLLLLGEDYYRGISGTSILAFFKKESALNIEIMLPEISNQIHFSQTVKQIEKIKQSQQQSLLELNNLFDSLAHEAFTGKLFSHQLFEQEIENGVKI
ncbi:restriction endonuclease subunit S [Methanosarcina vacuolata]|uniref:Type I restriction-modification system, specificity subunit S n=1 Tax=Methanosarcina vacuolata Z-761 TaxID=1434123 RepID=A0A0E3Q402_9EURY|nr:restriction endonuclease subunit S [Methanosarcina vacuolata]AKB44120.1 Type I restriction-modification system, specificity subunit S [Methanosarcina vacuolata Z-761]